MIMINILLLNKLTSDITVRLEEEHLASKSDADFVKRTDFDNKVKDATSNKNESNELSEKVKVLSTKGLTKKI